MVRCGTTWQVVPALFAAVHNEPISHTVTIKAGVTADLVGHILEAHLMSNLEKIQKAMHQNDQLYLMLIQQLN